jgi:hypothetical protein
MMFLFAQSFWKPESKLGQFQELLQSRSLASTLFERGIPTSESGPPAVVAALFVSKTTGKPRQRSPSQDA